MPNITPEERRLDFAVRSQLSAKVYAMEARIHASAIMHLRPLAAAEAYHYAREFQKSAAKASFHARFLMGVQDRDQYYA